MASEYPRRRLLVVDDEPLVRQTLSLCLDDEYDVKTVASGEEAIEACSKEIFPVVILDLCMEGISGIETLKRLKKIRELQKVIILTAYESVESAISALNLGAFNYLTKPFERLHLKEVVSRGFETYDQQNLRQCDIQQRLMSVHDAFFSLLCHEFNTPLNTILGFSDLLSQSSINPEHKSWIQEIHRSGTHLHEILMEIVDFIAASHLATSGIEQEFTIAPLLRPTLEAFEQKGIKVKMHGQGLEHKFIGQSDSARIIARKLISMASHRSNHICLEIWTATDEEGSTRLHMKVTGTGLGPNAIEKNEVQRLFEPYQCIFSDANGQGTSLGLELATCRKIAEHAQGSVDCFYPPEGELILIADIPVKLVD